MRLYPYNRSHSLRRLPRALPLLLGLLLLLGSPVFALAHPLGNFTVNHYTRLEPGSKAIALFYVLDMAEIPAFQERAETLDSDRDGEVSEAEAAAYRDSKTADLVSNLHLTVNGAELPLTIESNDLEFPEGQGGLLTLRLSARLVAALPEGETLWSVEFRDDNDMRRLVGWREIVVAPTEGVELLSSTAPAEDRSQELRNYPADLLQNPLTLRTASFSFQPGGVPASTAAAAPLASVQAAPVEGFEALIHRTDLGPGALMLALLAAFGWGAAHALTPGHGKTIVAAYLVGTRGTARHAVFLGLTTTITHTAGVFALGLATLFLSRYILPEQLYPWLGVLSGLLVVSIGFSLFGQRLRAFMSPAAAHSHDHDPRSQP